MRFLHTSDWHVGKPLRAQRRDDEYADALTQVLDIAKHERVDCVLIAGDVFDSSVPDAESERIVLEFFRELWGSEIPAVVISGNHDHPRRMNAWRNLLELIDVSVRAETVRPETGGIVEVPSRDGKESAQIAVLPWVTERKAREWESLMGREDMAYQNYAEDVARRIEELATHYTAGTVHILLAHVMMDGAIVGEGGGERPLHITEVYAVKPQRLPSTAHYIALGHLHRAQPVIEGRAYYSGSLLQLDFGEAGQSKTVQLIDGHPKRPADVRSVPITPIRQLRNIGSHKTGVTLDEIKALADTVGDDYLKVFVKVDRPLPGLAEQVREILPNAIDIVVERTKDGEREELQGIERMSPSELFTAYYRGAHQSDPQPALMALFDRLYEEVTGAAD